MDLPLSILPYPERPFGPRQPRVTAAAGRRNRRQHTTRVRIDFLNAILSQLKQVLAIERGSGVRTDIDRALGLPARWVERVQLVAGREPDVLAVERHPIDVFDARERSVLAEDLRRCSSHASILFDRKRTGE